MTETIVIDTDPGIDDAVAILLALAAPERLSLAALTTVAGNVGIETTTRNALALLDLAGRPDIPVYAGCARPILKRLETAEIVHGDDGLGGYRLPPPRTRAQPSHAVPALIALLRGAASPITLCTLGPMTNLALALIQAPDITAKIGRVISMGGAFFAGGNSSPTAEFNILVDPHAAAVVLAAGLDLTLMPLDLTHSVLTTPERLAAIAAIDTAIGHAVAGWLGHYNRHDMEKYGGPGGPLHDPTVIAYLLAPELFTTKAVAVEVELTGSHSHGMTVMDWWGTTGRPANCRVAHTIDVAGFYALLTDHLRRYP